MQFLHRLTPVHMEMVTIGPTSEEQAIVGEHFAHLETLVGQGMLLLGGRTQGNSPRTCGIVIFQSDFAEQTLAIMNSDPALCKNIICIRLRARLTTLHALSQGALDRLFGNQDIQR